MAEQNEIKTIRIKLLKGVKNKRIFNPSSGQSVMLTAGKVYEVEEEVARGWVLAGSVQLHRGKLKDLKPIVEIKEVGLDPDAPDEE